MTYSTPEKRQELRQQLTALAQEAITRRKFDYSAMIDSDPVRDYGERAFHVTDDPDSRLLREAAAEGTRLRGYARRHKIDLYGDQWIDPASLGGHAETLTGIFNRNVFTPAYRAWEDECTFTLARHLCAQRQFTDMIEHWENYTTPQRIDAAAWLSRLQQQVFARDLMAPAITCVHGFVEERTRPPHPRIVRGMHQSPGHGRRSHEMGFNTHADARFHELPAALDVIFHENLHSTQYALAAHAASGDIGPHHPLYREARLFAMAFSSRDSYIHTVDNVYTAHPLESDTHAQSKRFLTVTQVALQDNGLPPLFFPR